RLDGSVAAALAARSSVSSEPSARDLRRERVNAVVQPPEATTALTRRRCCYNGLGSALLLRFYGPQRQRVNAAVDSALDGTTCRRCGRCGASQHRRRGAPSRLAWSYDMDPERHRHAG